MAQFYLNVQWDSMHNTKMLKVNLSYHFFY